MGRDDIPVGLGDAFAHGQTDPTFPAIGDCKYRKAIPQGSGGFLDADSLYGLSHDLPSSPRRFCTYHCYFSLLQKLIIFCPMGHYAYCLPKLETSES